MAQTTSRAKACGCCKRIHETHDMVEAGWCWPCFADISSRALAEGYQPPPAGWYQVCDRCGVRTFVLKDRPLCPVCVRVPVRWSETLSVCQSCGGRFRCREGRGKYCCTASAVRYARVRIGRSKGRHTLAEWEALKEAYDHRCAYCGQLGPLTKDHVIPVSKLGSDGIDNILPACPSCNVRRSDRYTVDEFMALLTA